MNTDFEYIVPWNGANDTGRDVRLKLERNFQKIANDLWELVENDNDLLDLINQRLSKVDDDTAAGLITFLKGIITDSIRSRQYTSGALGAGFAAYINNSGRSVAEVDELIVRVKAIFHELVIEILSHVGGEVILSPASMKCIRVEDRRILIDAISKVRMVIPRSIMNSFCTIRQDAKPSTSSPVCMRTCLIGFIGGLLPVLVMIILICQKRIVMIIVIFLKLVTILCN